MKFKKKKISVEVASEPNCLLTYNQQHGHCLAALAYCKCAWADCDLRLFRRFIYQLRFIPCLKRQVKQQLSQSLSLVGGVVATTQSYLAFLQKNKGFSFSLNMAPITESSKLIQNYKLQIFRRFLNFSHILANKVKKFCSVIYNL